MVPRWYQGTKDLRERTDAQQPAKQLNRNDWSSVGWCWSGEVGQMKAEMGEWMDAEGKQPRDQQGG